MRKQTALYDLANEHDRKTCGRPRIGAPAWLADLKRWRTLIRPGAPAPQGLSADRSVRTGDPDRDAGASVAVYLARRSRRSQDARGLVDGAAADRQARDACGAVHLQMGDRRADRRRYRAGAAVELEDVADRFAADHDRELRRLADRDGGADPMARRDLRPGGDACGAQARLPHLRPHARTVAALSSGAQDRRTDAGAGARPSRHRSHRADGDPATGADHRRGLAADGACCCGSSTGAMCWRR